MRNRLIRAILTWTLFMQFAVFAKADQVNSLSDQELAAGWILLFDGETFFGWKSASDNDWAIADGAITATRGKPGLLHTTSQWGNFVLKTDFRNVKGGNSGVFLRSSPRPEDVNGRCYEVNIADWGTNDWPTGSIVQRKLCQTKYDSQDWQTFELTAVGGHFRVKIDGQEVIDYTDPRPLGRGFIGLQYRKGKIQFRNIKLKPLGMTSLFNGKSLAGWNSIPGSSTVATVVPEATLCLRGGPGALETVGRYGNFTFQMEVFVRGTGLNSGVFFRCIPGEKMNGYESQIHNLYRAGDRTKPQDCGTGGIFRRQDARKVVADDFTWFYETIHADDKHMAVWVNGYQVSDWTDRRSVHENPRKGLRLIPGTIQIQGHDPTTDLQFRKIRIAKLPQR